MIEDLILTIIPIGFIVAMIPMFGDPSYKVSTKTASAYAVLLLIQGLVFFRLDLFVSMMFTVVNALCWIALGVKGS